MSESPQGSISLGGVQALVGGLMAGVVGLLAVALVVRPPSSVSYALTQTQTLWLGVLLSMVVGAAVLVVVLSRVFVARSAANTGGEGGDDGLMVADFATLTIVRCAIVESVGLLGATAYLVADLGFALIVSVMSLVALSYLFPSVGRYEAYRERVTRPE